MGTEPTWIVITRDVSRAVRIQGETQLVAAMILDPATGLVHGASIAPTPHEVLAQTIQMALTSPPGPVPAQRPARVLCSPGQTTEITEELARLLASEAPEVRETEPVAAAEDVFDSFLGHMSGRHQPTELPAPEDWLRLIAAAHDYHLAAPWQRWSDTDHLDLVVRVDGNATRYVAIVLGQEGVQHGLVLYPGAVLSEAVRDRQEGPPVHVPPGTLMGYLDPPAEVPEELVAKAARYGWPADADLVPLWLAGNPEGISDVSRPQAHHLTLAMVAVLAHERTGTTKPTTGQVALTTNEHTGEHAGEFTISGPAT